MTKPVLEKHSNFLTPQGVIHGRQTRHGSGKGQFIHKINK